MTDIAELGFTVDSNQLVTGKERLDALSGAAVKAETASGKLTSGFASGRGIMAAFASGAGILHSKIVQLAAGFAAAFTAGKIISGLAHIANNIDDVSKAARRLGESVGNMQSLSMAADMAGVEFGALSNAGQKLNKTIALAIAKGKENEGVFKLLGISAKELTGIPIGEKFAMIADKMASMNLTADETALIISQLGDKTGTLTSLFEGGGEQIRLASDQLERFHGTLTDMQAKPVEDMNDAFSSLGYSLSALGIQLVAAFAPFVGPIVSAIAEGVGQMTGGIIALVNGTSDLIPYLEQIGVYAGLAFGPLVIGNTLAFAAAIVTGIIPATFAAIGAMWGLVTATAAWVAINPFTAFLAGIGIVAVALYVFRDKVKTVFGIDIVAAAANGVNKIIGAMVGAYNAISIIWGNFPAVMADLANKAAQGVVNAAVWMVNNVKTALQTLIGWADSAVKAMGGAGAGMMGIMATRSLEPVKAPVLENPNAGSASGTLKDAFGAFDKAMARDYVAGAMDAVKGIISGVDSASDKVRAAGGAVNATKGAVDSLAGAAGIAGGALGGMGGAAGAAAEKMSALQAISEELNNIAKPYDEAASAISKLNELQDNGVVTGEQYASMLDRIKAAFVATGGSLGQFANLVGSKTSEMTDQIKNFVQSSLTKLGDAFIDLALTGKANFADMAKSIISDMLKMMWQALIIKPILAFFGMGADGGLLGKVAGGIGAADANPVPTANRSPSLQIPQGKSGNAISIGDVHVTVEGSSGNKQQDEKHANRIGAEITEQLHNMIDERLAMQSRYGGMINPRGV